MANGKTEPEAGAPTTRRGRCHVFRIKPISPAQARNVVDTPPMIKSP